MSENDPNDPTGPTELVDLDDVQLCVRRWGGAADPVLLLVAGAAASMDLWPDAWCEALARGGRQVVAYDHRDTGRSTTGVPGRADYTGTTLADDAVALAERLAGGAPVHLVGMSMGGGIAQEVALRRPDLVASLTVVASSAVGGVDHDALPGPTPELQAWFADPPADPDWLDEEAYVAWAVEGEARFAGAAGGVGAFLDEVRALAHRTWRRSHDVAAAANHWLVVGEESEDGSGEPGALDVGDLRVPVLVVHGEADPLFPPAHAEALAAAVPGARLLVLPGMGHQVPPPPVRERAVRAVLDVTAR